MRMRMCQSANEVQYIDGSSTLLLAPIVVYTQVTLRRCETEGAKSWRGILA